MGAIALGLVAALAWGLHDLAVRYVSQRSSIYAALFTVLLTGLVLLVPVLWLFGVLAPIGIRAAVISAVSGVAFACAGVALYQAFAIGPVRLVAPIIGSFPVLSVGWAVLSGQPVGLWGWIAVCAVVAGIAIVSSGGDDASNGRTRAILWSIAAAIGFFVTFALGQAAAQGAETGASLLFARMAACLAALAIAALLRVSVRPGRRALPLLIVMGALDAVALSAVMVAGNLPFAAYASVAASVFGIITIILAWAFLREPMRAHQWAGVGLVFLAIGYLAAT